jgi:LuxR family transcriptional regulator, maltose regulon positive regulatory protein
MTAIAASPPRTTLGRAPSTRTALREASHAPTCPRRGSGLIERRELVGRLMATPDASLTLLVAPAGYGKSTLLADWSAADPRPFAWVRLRPAHDRPAELVRAIARALGDLGRRESTGSFVLVLDDCHVLQQAETVRTLSQVIDGLGSQANVAIASRTELPLPVARLRTERRLVELRAPDLTLTRGEVGRLAAAAGLTLEPVDADRLAKRTEGWAAGVYLAVLAVANDADPGRSLSHFGGDDRLVADYVREEILGGLPRQVIEFLVRSSIIERLSGPLCDHVLERRDSGRVLDRLSRMNLLLVPLDRTGTEFRYHRLLAQTLRHELAQREPSVEAALHLRASTWHESHGEPELAIEHAIEADELSRAGRLLWEESRTLLAYGRRATLMRHLTRFSAEQIGSCAPLALTAAAAHLVMGDKALVEHWTTSALTAAGPKPADGWSPVGLRLMRAAVADSDLVSIRDEAVQGYAATREDSAWRSLACLLEGTSEFLMGDGGSARERLEEGARRGAAVAPAIQVLCLAQLALIAMGDGEWDRADGVAARARAQAERVGVADYPTCALMFAASAAIEAHFGRVETCARHTRDADRLLSELGGFTPWYSAECRLALAYSALRSGELARARRLLEIVEDDLKALPEATTARAWLDAYKARSDDVSSSRSADADPLTTAELRVLQFLPTHLSFPQIAEHLYVSTNTVKTHARALYRKLDASSRSEAVAHACAGGLIDSAH